MLLVIVTYHLRVILIHAQSTLVHLLMNCSRCFGWAHFVSGWVCAHRWAMNSIPSTSCRSGLVCKRHGEPCSQTSRASNGQGCWIALAGWELQNSRGSHWHIWCKWHPLGWIQLQSFSPESCSSWATFWIISLLTFISPFFLYSFPRPAGVLQICIWLSAWPSIVFFRIG